MEFLGVSYVDWVGYMAMATLFVSFMMKDIKKLRIINSIGGGFFVAYGVLLDMSWPIIIANSAIIGINVYYLFLKKN
jgi:hypothetical protein